MLTGMDSISRYHISVREDGLWNVIDTKSGGPVELEVQGMFWLLYGLPKEAAEEWSKRLNEYAGMFSHKNPSR